jgi:hypothetical protein
MEIYYDSFTTYSLKLFLKDHVLNYRNRFELQKSFFALKHACIV